MTPRTSFAAASIGQVRDDFLRGEAGRSVNAEDASRLRRFVTWCGISTSIEAIQPYKIEEFLQQQINTSSPPRTYMPVLKALFAFAYSQGTVAQDPMKIVRLPRGSGGLTRKAAAPAVKPAAPKAAPRESDVVYVSRSQHETMQTELERLRTEERHRISQMLHDAIKDGDLSENAAYDDAKMRQGMLEARIRELEAKLRNIELIEDQDRTTNGIAVGSRVNVKELGSGDEMEFYIVGPEETNPRNGKISHLSPLGRAMLGKAPGDEVEVSTPNGRARYHILSAE
jgi:transcription elongation factor GreA